MEGKTSTNHLDKLMGTFGQFTGVQLKRTDREDKTLYQVEMKVKGATPPRNVSFGSYNALEKAKRAFNIGMYIMGSGIHELLYYFPDNAEILKICPDSIRTRLYNAVWTQDSTGSSEMRKLIKKYIEDCNCSQDSDAFKRRVFNYWRDAEKQPKVQRTAAQRAAQGLDRQASEPSPSPGGGTGESRRSAARSQQTNQGAGEQVNQMHNTTDPVLNDAPPPMQRRKRVYTSHAVEDDTNNTNDTDYTDLPPHFYGIVAHGGEIGMQEYPPQLDCNGDFSCPCFFNHNFNVRSQRTQLVGLEGDWPDIDWRSWQKSFSIENVFLSVCIIRVGYNYEASECVQEYYKGPLPLKYIDQCNSVCDMHPDYSIYYESGDEEGNQQPTHSMQTQYGAGTVQSQQLYVTVDGYEHCYDPRTGQLEPIQKHVEGYYFVHDRHTNEIQRVTWDEQLKMYVYNPSTGEWTVKI